MDQSNNDQGPSKFLFLKLQLWWSSTKHHSLCISTHITREEEFTVQKTRGPGTPIDFCQEETSVKGQVRTLICRRHKTTYNESRAPGKINFSLTYMCLRELSLLFRFLHTFVHTFIMHLLYSNCYTRSLSLLMKLPPNHIQPPESGNHVWLLSALEPNSHISS